MDSNGFKQGMHPLEARICRLARAAEFPGLRANRSPGADTSGIEP